jgi:hypothetical protein
MDFNDIKMFPFSGFEVDIPFRDIIKWVEKQIEDGLNIAPDFQRGHVWTDEQRSRFIEYQLSGGENGKTILLNHPGWSGRHNKNGPYEIIDGLQRLTSVIMFMENKMKAFDLYRSEFTGQIRSHIGGLKWRIYELQTRQEVLEFYINLNSGGTPHSKEEIERVKKLLEAEKK